MLRKSLVALMLGVLCTGSAIADDTTATKPTSNGLFGWLNRSGGQNSTKQESKGASATGKLRANAKAASKPAAGVERAVVSDAERQAVSIRRTAAVPQDSAPGTTVQAPSVPALQPVPMEQAPVLPNISSVSGPQYFSATPAGQPIPQPAFPGNNWQTYQAPMPTSMTSAGYYTPAPNPAGPAGPVYNGQAPVSIQSGGTYPQTGAALYPAPVPGIPHQIGGIAVANPAFHHHEMLYPHQYKALYPPYYYKVNGGWMVTPFGVWSHEDWRLQGTQVDVKYKSHISPFTLFTPPYHR